MSEKKNQIDEEKYKEFEMYLKRFFNENLADKFTDAFTAIDESVNFRIQEMEEKILKKI